MRWSAMPIGRRWHGCYGWTNACSSAAVPKVPPRAAAERCRKPPLVAESRPEGAAPAWRGFRPMESYCLAILVQYPYLLYRLDRLLQEQGLSPLSVEDFEYTDHRQLVELLRRALTQDVLDSQLYLREHVPTELRERLRELEGMVITERLEDRLLEELARNVIHLRRRLFREGLGQLRFLQEEAQQEKDERLTVYQQMAREYAQLLRTLDMAYRRLMMVRG